MIDEKLLRYNGKYNYQNGLLFYFSNQAHVVTFSFLVTQIKDKKRRIKVTMQPDINHERPHVHIDNHGASFAIDTGELLAGQCSHRIQQLMTDWVLAHKEDLLDLWRIIKDGRDYNRVVERIQNDKSFKECGFNGNEPNNSIIVDGVKIWYDGELIQENNGADLTKHFVSEGNMYVLLPRSYKEGRMLFDSSTGQVQFSK